MTREGSMDDFPERVPRHEYGLRVDLAGIAEIRSNLRKMRHLMAAGAYHDDLPPEPFDPAQAQSA